MGKPRANWLLPASADGDIAAAKQAKAKWWNGLTEDQKEVNRRSKVIGINGQSAAISRMRFCVCLNPKAAHHANEAAICSIVLEWWDVYEPFVSSGRWDMADWRSFCPSDCIRSTNQQHQP